MYFFSIIPISFLNMSGFLGEGEATIKGGSLLKRLPGYVYAGAENLYQNMA